MNIAPWLVYDLTVQNGDFDEPQGNWTRRWIGTLKVRRLGVLSRVAWAMD